MLDDKPWCVKKFRTIPKTLHKSFTKSEFSFFYYYPTIIPYLALSITYSKIVFEMLLTRCYLAIATGADIL